MKYLTVEKYDNAIQFILTHARKLEQQLYYYHFKPIDSSQSDVITELLKYQNQDGGFGNALEPNVRMNKSSIVEVLIEV